MPCRQIYNERIRGSVTEIFDSTQERIRYEFKHFGRVSPGWRKVVAIALFINFLSGLSLSSPNELEKYKLFCTTRLNLPKAARLMIMGHKLAAPSRTPQPFLSLSIAPTRR